MVKLIYDHRVLDGAYVARRLRDIEETLHGPILEELNGAPAVMADGPAAASPAVGPLLKPPSRAPRTARDGEAAARRVARAGPCLPYSTASPASWSVVTRTSSRLITRLRASSLRLMNRTLSITIALETLGTCSTSRPAPERRMNSSTSGISLSNFRFMVGYRSRSLNGPWLWRISFGRISQ